MPVEKTQRVQGIDRAAHDTFVDWVAENPAAATIEFSATGTTEDVAVHTKSTIGEFVMGEEARGHDREYTIDVGLPAEMEDAMGYVDPVDRCEAIELALAGLTACINGTVQLNAMREGIAVEDVTTTVSVPFDPRVLLGIHDEDRAAEMLGDLDVEVQVTGADLSEADIDRIKSFPRRSPVFNLLTRAHPTEPTVHVAT
ncbi:OsmC family protein [Haloarchaeobius amylolyticus]|uniref:OsmC family protein n=1 Tax=Haloarchaeobius amylolyticus TaxID=1198296 RepID=UPI00226EF936|nr:OsmC family protein [Haloarchaeobius amylolyticus]